MTDLLTFITNTKDRPCISSPPPPPPEYKSAEYKPSSPLRYSTLTWSFNIAEREIFKNIVIVFIAYYVNQSALLIHVNFPVYD
jgi:hypothetical protein